MLCPLGSAVDASAYDITVSEGENGAYWGTAPDGVSQLGFEVYQDQVWNDSTQNYEYVYRMWLSNFKIHNSEVELPDSVTVSTEAPDTELAGRKFPITRLGNSGFNVNWYDSDGISLVIPAVYSEIGNLFHSWDDNSGNYRVGFPVQMTFKGTVPPSLNGDSSSETLYIVPAEALEAYRLKCANEEDGWRSDFLVFPVNYRENVTEVNAVAGTLEEQLIAAAGSLENIYDLKITGEINGRDMNSFAKMKYLHTLDLSALDLRTIRGCEGMRFLEEVKLPASVTILDDGAFRGCWNLRTINLANVTTIGNSAFFGCRSLDKIELPMAEKIGSRAFDNCSTLTSVDIPNIKRLEGSIFSSCPALTNVNIPNVEELAGSNFSDCYSLTNISIPKVKRIEGSSFSGCSSLSQVELSPELEYIGYKAFAYTAIKEFRIPFGLEVDSHAFDQSAIERLYLYSNRTYISFSSMPALTNIYSYDPIPSGGATTAATLHVPGFSLPMFIDNPDYYGVNKIVALEEDLTELNVYSDLTISSAEGLADKFDLHLESDHNYFGMEAHLDNSSVEPLSIGHFNQIYGYDSNWNGEHYDFYPYTTFINNGVVTADSVSVQMPLNRGSWNFISLPYNVNLAEVVTPQEALWVVREYSGEIRANRADNTIPTWVNVPAGSTLKGGKGYIFHFDSNNGDDFTFPAADDETKNALFAKDDVSLNLEYHPSEFAHNASWNLIGNPYDACFDISQIEFEAPVTIWNGGNYEALSLVDDSYVLRPFEAFFVQAPRENSAILFHKEGRSHTATTGQNNAPRRMAASNPDRAIINLHISGNGSADRTRLVINEAASEAYEISCDASKFLSTEESVPQIYMMEQGQRLAIDERPLGAAEFTVGFRAGADGEYSVSVDTRNADYSVILRDNLTGVETDLGEASYAFAAKAGTDDSRFSLCLKTGASGISGIDAGTDRISVNGNILDVTAEGEINVYSIDGVKMAAGEDTLSTSLPAGIYVVKTTAGAVKVNVGR